MALIDRIRLASVALFGGTQKAAGMLAGIFPASAGSPPKRGARELIRAYNEMPWLRATVNKVGISIASTTWRLFVVRREGKAVRHAQLQRAGWRSRAKMTAVLRKQTVLQEIEAHPLLDLLDASNPFLPGLSVRQLTQVYLDLVGESFWLLERNGAGKPVALWPLPPDWIAGTPTLEKPIFRVSYRGFQAEIPATEFVWFRDVDPANPYERGSGTAAALGDELETDEYAAKHTKQWFFNRARPDLLISGEGLSREDTARLEQDWISKHQGFWRAFKPYFLNRKIEVQTLSQTFENMQLVDLRKYERDTIVQVYGVPPEILGILANSNRATIEAADFLFARWVLVPRLELLRVTLQERLVPEFDERLIIDYDSPVSEDKEHKLKVAQAAPWALRVDEWRELQEQEPLPDGQGQVFMLPFNLFPSHNLAPAPPSPEPAGSPPPPPGGAEAGGAPGPLDQAAAATARAGKALDPRMIDAILKALTAGKMLERMRPVYRDAIAAFGSSTLADLDLGVSFDLSNPRVIDFLETRSAERVRGIDDTTRAALQAALAEGTEAGEVLTALSQRVRDTFAAARGRRGAVIARTESVRGANFGITEAFRQGGVEQKEWLATRDGNVRDEHEFLDGQVQPLDKPFAGPGGEEGMYPGDFAQAYMVVNCRCTTLAVIDTGAARSILDTEEKRAAYWKRFEQDRQPFERRALAAVTVAFDAQEAAMLEKLQELGGE